MSPNRQRWLRAGISLGSLLLVALFMARGTTHYLAEVLLPIDEVEVRAQPDAPGSATASRRTRDAESVYCRSVFDTEVGSLCQAEGACSTDEDCAESQTCQSGACVDNQGCGGNDDCETGMLCQEGTCVIDPSSEQDYPNCAGTVRVVGTTVIPRRPAQSFASIAGASGTPMLYREGMNVEDWQLLSIETHRVLMQPSGGALCQVVMFAQEGAPPARPPAATTPAPSAVRVSTSTNSSGPSTAELDSNITRVSDSQYRVNRTLLNSVLEDQGALMRSARVIPHQEGGQTVGVKLYGIRRNSLLGRLGIQNGDMLRSVNGFNMTEPDEALRAYTRLRNAENLTVSLVRRGQPVNIEYAVQ